MKWLIALLLVLLLTTLMFAKDVGQNGTAPQSPHATPSTTLPKPLATLAGTRWVWQKTTLKSGDVVPPNPQQFVITFHPQGQFSTSTDCNSGSGDYKEQGEILTIGPIATTEMACSGKILEQAYYAQLQNVATFSIEGNKLTLTLKNEGVMRFLKQ